MTLPRGRRARTLEDAIGYLNDMLDHLEGGLGDEEIRADAKVSASKFRRAIVPGTIGATQTRVPHGLGVHPKNVMIRMRSAGQIWESADADLNWVYLTADAANRKCIVTVEG